MRRRPGGPYRIDLQNPVANHPLNVGLVSWWLPLPHLFGGGRLWDLRNHYHGTLGATTEAPTWRDYGLSFDGGDDIVTFPDFSSQFGNEATITFWLKRRLATPINDSDSGFVLFDTAGSGGSTHYPYTNELGYFSVFRSSRLDAVVLSSTVNRAQWHQLAITSKNGGSYRVYQNGIEIASTSGDAVVLPATCYLGRGTAFAFYDGLFQSVKLYNRELSVAEVFQDYQQSLTGHPDTLRRYPERSWFLLRESEAAAGGLSVVIASHHYRQMAAAG